jgi:hypothetical protein
MKVGLGITSAVVAVFLFGCAPSDQPAPTAPPTPTATESNTITDMDFESGEAAADVETGRDERDDQPE